MAVSIQNLNEYAELLQVVRDQVELARSGNLDAAVARMAARQALIERAPAASASDALLIQEVLKLDRELSGLIRERMVRIRDESLALQRGKTAMRGYARFRRAPGDRLSAGC